TICDQFARESRVTEATLSSGYSYTNNQLKQNSRYKAGWCRQFRAVLWRSWLSLMREP
ncbi:hypothetical protein X975_02698, partial [Stegodyphus mimosarum]